MNRKRASVQGKLFSFQQQKPEAGEKRHSIVQSVGVTLCKPSPYHILWAYPDISRFVKACSEIATDSHAFQDLASDLVIHNLLPKFKDDVEVRIDVCMRLSYA